MNAGKLTSYGMLGLIAIGVIVFIMSLSGSYDAILNVSYIYMVLGLLAALVGAGAGIMNKPHAAKGILIGIGGMLVVLLIGYVLADGSDYEQYNTTEGLSKLSGTLLYSLYVLMGLSVVTIVASAVMKLIR